ncbi:MAG: hypothetical protein JO045_18865 [Mycobacterium sp.]|jgi:hypothetical protein|nr:hypothetical protein [Mycobacterium sp.]MBV8346640.1 hypothetical protein [Mycolicibacterium sp.]
MTEQQVDIDKRRRLNKRIAEPVLSTPTAARRPKVRSHDSSPAYPVVARNPASATLAP